MSREPKEGDVITIVEGGVTKVGRVAKMWGDGLYVLVDGVHRSIKVIKVKATLGELAFSVRSRYEINTMISVCIADLAAVNQSFSDRLDALSDQDAVTLLALLDKIE